MTTKSPPSSLSPGSTQTVEDSGAALRIRGLVRTFISGGRTITAVDGVDLSTSRGEVVALLGPNGAGKTTLLDMALGLSTPSGGTVHVFGAPPRRAVTDGRLAAVLQTGGLLSDITVGETVHAIASLHGAADRAEAAMARAHLTDIKRRRIGKCSGGEQQRVKFALALLPDPDVLILDEPTAGMDVSARRSFWEAMHQDADSGRTIIFATHYLEEAEQFARRTVVMNHGRIVADGDTAELRASLGGRTLTATLPGDRTAAESIIETVRSSPETTDWLVDGRRLTVRSADSDAVAQALLGAGAFDLEIVAPSLERAFTALTDDHDASLDDASLAGGDDR